MSNSYCESIQDQVYGNLQYPPTPPRRLTALLWSLGMDRSYFLLTLSPHWPCQFSEVWLQRPRALLSFGSPAEAFVRVTSWSQAPCEDERTVSHGVMREQDSKGSPGQGFLCERTPGSTLLGGPGEGKLFPAFLATDGAEVLVLLALPSARLTYLPSSS